MYILKDIHDAVALPLTVSSFSYFFMPRWKKDLYITVEEYERLRVEKEKKEAEEQLRKELAIKQWREKKAKEDSAWESFREGAYNRWKAEEEAKKGLSVDSSMPDYSNCEYFNKKADHMKDTLNKNPFDHQHPLTNEDHHHHKDHYNDHHNDHKSSWGHDVGWDHGSDSTHGSHDSHSHDSSSSCDSGGCDSGGDCGGGD